MNRPSNQLFDAYFTQSDMRDIFSDEGRVQGMLDFEAALARAQARIGLIPQQVVADI
ncbi:3-carboxy-cis,cis-muconate cycloisomerase, partial [Pseudomonas syringae pv. actinidiae ICMP 19070]